MITGRAQNGGWVSYACRTVVHAHIAMWRVVGPVFSGRRAQSLSSKKCESYKAKPIGPVCQSVRRASRLAYGPSYPAVRAVYYQPYMLSMYGRTCFLCTAVRAVHVRPSMYGRTCCLCTAAYLRPYVLSMYAVYVSFRAVCTVSVRAEAWAVSGFELSLASGAGGASGCASGAGEALSGVTVGVGTLSRRPSR